MSIENIIFSNLMHNEDYGRKVLPFLSEEYFAGGSQRILFGLIKEYVDKYNGIPSKEALGINLSEKTGMSQQSFNEVRDIIVSLEPSESDPQWLTDQTEKFCQEKAIYNAIMKSITIIDDKTGELAKGSIPKILQDALGVSFDTSVGHDYLQDSDLRYDFYHRKEDRLPFDLALLNEITRGGLPKKTLNVILAGTGVGKSLAMCHMAAHNLTQHKNVLYITMEMAEEKIAERVDANLLNVTVDELMLLPKDSYDKKINRLRENYQGKLIVKEYPTATVGSAHFRHLINELRLKRNFTPDVIYIDYLNICASSRIKSSANVNSYTLIKAIAEELRGLAVEFSVPIVTATQTTRSGFANSDVELTDTSESFGLPATADFMIALMVSEEMDGLGQLMIKQLKNRYNDPTINKRFVVGVDRSKFRLYDVEQSAQDGILDGPVFDNTKFSTTEDERKQRLRSLLT
jgi:archaellum biogenesis ATPase FlaH